eukprot:TRINITY_DN16151_c0_g1_i1.p1 TRINITY_DN16151_c0_g1~~TRINITY_DN16151_c0_g1_i1.p1  ORF type:complete len:482 (+),score=118.41 TRINITY_DN16151_c0_g1_i1:101-1546(+)
MEDAETHSRLSGSRHNLNRQLRVSVADVEAPTAVDNVGKGAVRLKGLRLGRTLSTRLGGVRDTFAVMVLGSRLNVLLLCLPVLMLPTRRGYDHVVFTAALLCMVSLAERMSFVTEELCKHTSDTIGGFVNATFGNATEVLVSLSAMRKGLYRMVQLTLLGSIIANLLLVLGLSCFLGGLRWKVQFFNVVSGAVSPSLLLLSVTGILLPAALKMSGQEDDREDNVNFSRFVSVILLMMYAGFLLFQLRTHSEEFQSTAPDPDYPTPSPHRGGKSPPPGASRAPTRTFSFESNSTTGQHTGLASPVPPLLTLGDCLMWLFGITMLVSFVSEALVASIKGFTVQTELSSVFVSAVIIPILSNAPEHAAAVLFAWKNRMDVSIGVSLGSSTQIALGVLPACVLCGWLTGHPITLFFKGFETAALTIAVIIDTVILQSGTSNWLMGLLLVGSYAIVACGFWIHERENLSAAKAALPVGSLAPLPFP